MRKQVIFGLAMHKPNEIRIWYVDVSVGFPLSAFRCNAVRGENLVRESGTF
jgi:hypothetical protein